MRLFRNLFVSATLAVILAAVTIGANAAPKPMLHTYNIKGITVQATVRPQVTTVVSLPGSKGKGGTGVLCDSQYPVYNQFFSNYYEGGYAAPYGDSNMVPGEKNLVTGAWGWHATYPAKLGEVILFVTPAPAQVGLRGGSGGDQIIQLTFSKAVHTWASGVAIDPHGGTVIAGALCGTDPTPQG